MGKKSPWMSGSFNSVTNVYTPPFYGPPKKGLEKISKNCYRGVNVRTFEELVKLSNDHKSVIIWHGPSSGWSKITAAAWMLSRRGRDLADYFKWQSLYHCVKEEDF